MNDDLALLVVQLFCNKFGQIQTLQNVCIGSEGCLHCPQVIAGLCQNNSQHLDIQNQKY